LIDDSLTAGSNGAKQQIVAEALRRRGRGTGLAEPVFRRLPRARSDLFHDEQGGKQGADPLSQLGMLCGVFGERGTLAPAIALEEGLD
jgi:hypothetical protein